MPAYPRTGDTFGRYSIVRRIGRGGMSAVFEARQLDFDRSVALKILSPDLSEDPDFRARFATEAATLAALESPHVVQVYDHGTQDDQLFISMQLIRGRDLAALLAESGPLPAAEALELVAQVARGLSDAHRAGLLHRDVKPANILVRESEGELFAYVCDFGIARAVDSQHTRTRGVMGTMGYMAPERHSGADASVATDVYSLGCVLWAALTGEAPYGRTSDVQVALAHMQAPVPVYEGSTAARDSINTLLQGTMAKDPASRFATMPELRRALVDAHLEARGLRAVRTHETQLRPAGKALAGGAPGRQHGPAYDRRQAATNDGPARGRWGIPVAALAVAAVVVGTGAGGVKLLSGSSDEGRRPAAVSAVAGSVTSATSATTRPSASPARTVTAAKRPTPRSSTAASVPSTAPESPTTPEASTTVPVESKVCWDGQKVFDASDCAAPVGRRGLEAVFPSLDDSSACVPRPPSVQEKIEVFTCYYRDFLVRYSRWDASADRPAYFDEANYKPLKYDWLVDQEFAGTEWWSEDHSDGQTRPYQYSATYRDAPYSVSVEGTSVAARRAGLNFMRATPPSKLGLAP